MMMYSHPSFLNCILFLTCPGQLPGRRHFSGAPGLFSIACLHLHTETTSPCIFSAIVRIRASLPPHAQTRRPTFLSVRSGILYVVRIAPVVLVVGSSSSAARPVNAPPMMISPTESSLSSPPAISISSPTEIPTGTSMNT